MKIAYSKLLFALVFLCALEVQADFPKQIVGATEVIQVEEQNLPFTARVDTGAKISSIHAENIEVDLTGDPRGKPITFYGSTRISVGSNGP